MEDTQRTQGLVQADDRVLTLTETSGEDFSEIAASSWPVESAGGRPVNSALIKQDTGPEESSPESGKKTTYNNLSKHFLPGGWVLGGGGALVSSLRCTSFCNSRARMESLHSVTSKLGVLFQLHELCSQPGVEASCSRR